MTVESRYQSLLKFLYRAPIGLIQADRAGKIEMINPISARLLMPLLRGGALDNLFTALHDVAPQLRQLATGAADSDDMICEALRIPLPAGGAGLRGPGYLSLSLIKLDDTRLIAVLVDITQEVRREQEALSETLGAAARFDTLTRMPNRLAILERLQLVLRRTPAETQHAFALFYVKCDRWTQVNDTFGHPVGDQLLSLLASRLRAVFRISDQEGVDPMVAHVSEGKFIVLLEGAERADDVHPVARRLVDALAEPYLIGPGEIHCGVSIGVVQREAVGEAGDADAVLRDASLAMAEAERCGGGRYVIFDQAMLARATLRGDLEAALRRALTENQLHVVYQPVVGLQGSGRTADAIDRSAGVEALVRWRHPTLGVVSPDVFVGIAEECGLIGALGEFVLQTACDQFVAWHAQLGSFAPNTLAVNLSRGQIGQAGLVARVDNIIHSSGIPPGRLQLEVTESLAAQSPAVQARLHELKALGLTLALDDFGTGYSSLSSLDQFPVDTIKIDRSFVTDAPTSHHRRALVDATIRVAHALNMTTVAEGIENEAQARVIRDLGCDKGQGYLFSKPLVPADFVQWLLRS
jgi:diguanylate cyclase (GGDEF)-like protein